MDKIEIVFEGLDTHATVTLNNKVILNADNMFRSWIVDVKDVIKPTKNRLKVLFKSVVKYDDEELRKFGKHVLPSSYDDAEVYSRKAAYHFGWDWGPKIVTCGIWKPVNLRGWQSSKIDNVR